MYDTHNDCIANRSTPTALQCGKSRATSAILQHIQSDKTIKRDDDDPNSPAAVSATQVQACVMLEGNVVLQYLCETGRIFSIEFSKYQILESYEKVRYGAQVHTQ